MIILISRENGKDCWRDTWETKTVRKDRGWCSIRNKDVERTIENLIDDRCGNRVRKACGEKIRIIAIIVKIIIAAINQ